MAIQGCLTNRKWSRPNSGEQTKKQGCSVAVSCFVIFTARCYYQLPSEYLKAVCAWTCLSAVSRLTDECMHVYNLHLNKCICFGGFHMFACLASVPWPTFQGHDIYIRIQHCLEGIKENRMAGSSFLPVHTGEGKLQLHSDKPHQRQFPYSQAPQLAGVRSPNTALCWQWGEFYSAEQP